MTVKKPQPRFGWVQTAETRKLERIHVRVPQPERVPDVHVGWYVAPGELENYALIKETQLPLHRRLSDEDVEDFLACWDGPVVPEWIAEAHLDPDCEFPNEEVTLPSVVIVEDTYNPYVPLTVNNGSN